MSTTNDLNEIEKIVKEQYYQQVIEDAKKYKVSVLIENDEINVQGDEENVQAFWKYLQE